MSNTTYKIQAFIDEFIKKDKFTKEDIYKYFLKININYSKGALKSKIHRLKKSNIIKSVSRGVYTISKKTYYTISPDSFIKKIIKKFLKRYEDVNYCVWNTMWLNEFMIQQPFKSFYVFETEKEVSESVFHWFRDNNIMAYLNPNQEMIQEYVMQEKNTIIIKPVITRAPIQKVEEVQIPEIEKILVDLFCEQNLFYVHSGSELKNIFKYSNERYIINYTTLYSYARRRGKEEALKQFVSKIK